ncbi:hypothetical protein BLX05_26320 [Bacillus pseudomycoides]|nr:hypothetical protein BLX05_26320 [Bacillus pseudomycoides]
MRKRKSRLRNKNKVYKSKLKNRHKSFLFRGESIRPCIEAVRSSSCPMPSENRERKRVQVIFFLRSSDLYVEKSKWIYIV